MPSNNPEANSGPGLRLEPHPERWPGAGKIVVAFSGGPDSVCLLHLLVECRPEGRLLLAVHVDHGLDRGSSRRALQAVEIAETMGVECRVERVRVRRSGSIEANARRARYAALAGHVEAQEILLTAHHADDVAETMLLRLLRGSGPGGLGGIPGRRNFAGGWLLRPLLRWRREQILAYLRAHGLDATHDPANDLLSMDRNFLRHEVMPLLHERFPGCINGFARSAALNQSAAGVLSDLAAKDVVQARKPGPRLDLKALRRLDRFRRSEALRSWCVSNGQSPPPGARLDEFMRQLEHAAEDRHPELRWDEGRLRRHGDAVWLDHIEPADQPWSLPWDGRGTLDLPGRSGTLHFDGNRPDLKLEVCSGGAGERVCPSPRSGHQAVKKLLASQGVPPWLRMHWPRLWWRGELVAVGDQWLDHAFSTRLQEHGCRLVWCSQLCDLVTS